MDFLSHKEQKLFFETMSTLHGSIIGLDKIQSLRDETNPNAQTYIIDAEPESVDITLEVTNRNKDVTELLITQNNDRFSSERTVSFPTDKLTNVETIRTLRDVVKTQYKSDAMRTILQNSLLFHHTKSSVEETKDACGKTEFTYTFWGYGSDPVRFVMNETFMDLPPRGGSLQYQEFDTFDKKWKTQASYLSEALMSTKNHVSGNDTIVGIPKIYGDKWSIDNFVTKQTLRKTLEQNLIMAPLHQITNDTKLLDTINQDYDIAYKIPDPNENRICDVDLYIFHTGQEITEPNEHTKRFIMRYQHPANSAEFGYFTAYDPTGPEPKLIARVPHTSDSIADMIELTNHLKDLSGPAIEKQVTQKKQLSRFSLNHNVTHEENEDLEP